MVKNGQTRRRDTIAEVRFHNPRLEPLGVETLTLAELQTKVPPEHFARPERIDFYLLMLFTAGQGEHRVDFINYPVRERTLIFVQPKQVQEYCFNPSLKGRMLLIDPVFLCPPTPADQEPSLLEPDWQVWSELSDGLSTEVSRAFHRIARETADYQGDDLTRRILRHVTFSLLLEIKRFARQGRPVSASHRGSTFDVWPMLKNEIERSYHRERSVRHYARRLGYSEKTLTRACLIAAGRTAKDMIDERVALEAKRLLAHSDDGIAEIGSQLGFSETTNFVKFFKRIAAVSPSTFRSRFGSAAGNSG